MGVPSTLTEAAAALRSGTLSSVALTEAVIARADALDGDLGVYITRMDNEALNAAAAADRDFTAGIDRGPLQGIPIGVKDIIATRDAPTTAQSLILNPAWGAGIDAPVVARLRAAGAVITGKTTTMEFAVGMPDANKPFPVPHNPWDLERWPGGSSSGSGAGVAAGLFFGALGTDTGGSIRLPAAYCGITGLKPTYGRVPKSGCAPLGYSLDHIGPMARSARDCAAILEVLAGYDASDPTCSHAAVPPYLAALTGSVKGIRIGVERVNHLTAPNADPVAVAAFEDAAAWFISAGALVEEVAVPYYQEIRSANTVTMRGESTSYHLGDLRTRWEDYGVHTSKAVSQGAIVGAADYVQAQRFRSLARRVVAAMMEPLDVLLMPTALMGAPRLAGLDHTSFMNWPTFTQPWNLLGLPALALPMGFTAAGLPLSMQVVGKPFAEATVLRVGDAYQRKTSFHLERPTGIAAVAA
ncbi:MAG: amidase [Dehalococcoidia bacterium]|nr:MAG: amidase [Dehalococcoidia bacterium]